MSCRLAIETTFLASFYKTVQHLVRRGGRSQPSPLLGLEGSDLGPNFKEEGQKISPGRFGRSCLLEGGEGGGQRGERMFYLLDNNIFMYSVISKCSPYLDFFLAGVADPQRLSCAQLRFVYDLTLEETCSVQLHERHLIAKKITFT